jgi:hypothetical protein
MPSQPPVAADQRFRSSPVQVVQPTVAVHITSMTIAMQPFTNKIAATLSYSKYAFEFRYILQWWQAQHSQQ